MRYLGLDYGTKRIGVAISDAARGFAFPRETIPNDYTTIDRLKKLIIEEGIGAVILGDARAVNGAENPITAEAERFAQTLKTHCKIPVEMASEAWSSVEAGRFSPKGREHDDSAAAAIILQRYLDMNTKSEEIGEEI